MTKSATKGQKQVAHDAIRHSSFAADNLGLNLFKAWSGLIGIDYESHRL